MADLSTGSKKEEKGAGRSWGELIYVLLAQERS